MGRPFSFFNNMGRKALKSKKNIKNKSNMSKNPSKSSSKTKVPKMKNVVKTKGVTPKYRELKANLYNKTIQKTSCGIDEVPICKCNPKDGCNENCINRQLFMECGVGCCPSLFRRTNCHSNLMLSSTSCLDFIYTTP